jgi:uncharacterized protein (UPF0332 family)
MSFNWKDYFDLAQELLKKSEECYLRSSISRAYYGVFCMARDKAGLKDYRPNFKKGEPGIHEKVISTYRNSLNREKKLAGRTLDTLRRSRNKADYNGDIIIKGDDAKRAIQDASNVLNNLGV